MKNGGFEHPFAKRRKSCPLKAAGIREIDYKNVALLSGFITEKGKILPRRISGVCAKMQTQLAVAVKRARYMGLLSFVGEMQ